MDRVKGNTSGSPPNKDETNVYGESKVLEKNVRIKYVSKTTYL